MDVFGVGLRLSLSRKTYAAITANTTRTAMTMPTIIPVSGPSSSLGVAAATVGALVRERADTDVAVAVLRLPLASTYVTVSGLVGVMVAPAVLATESGTVVSS
jgi:hypothetical protein